MTARCVPSRLARGWILGLLLTASVLGAEQLGRGKTTPSSPPPDLEAIIPTELAGWRALPRIGDPTTNPEVAAKVEAAYSRTLQRVYVDEQGRSIMLSIAYGGNQIDDSLQAHRPEYCYAAQGFDVASGGEATVQTAQGRISVRRLLTRYANRIEPVTYWLTIGDQTALPGLSRKLQQLRYGLAGEVPDGMLVRVSSLDRDPAAAYRLQDQFIGRLLAAMPEADRSRIAGRRADSDTAIPHVFSVSTQTGNPNRFQ
jgi:EpsI family protein